MQPRNPTNLAQLLHRADDRTSFRDFLEMANDLVSIKARSGEGDVKNMDAFAKVFLKKFEDDLIARKKEWHDLGSAKLAYVVSQLEAICYLTGLRSRLFDNEDVPYIKSTFKMSGMDKYVGDNFLHRTQALSFANFDRSMLALQLLVRVADFKKIDQRGEEVCGPVVFMQGVAANDAMVYARFVVELAEKGKAVMSMKGRGGAQGLEVELDKECLSQESRFHEKQRLQVEREQKSQSDEEQESQDAQAGGVDVTNVIHEADFIGLVGLRAYFNSIVSYSRGSRTFGVTTLNEIAEWMKMSGFDHISSSSLKNKEDVKRLQKLLRYGYSLVYNTTAEAAAAIMEGELPESVSSFPKQLLDGHFVQITSMRYLDASDEVELVIVTWGQEAETVRVKLSDLVKMSGVSLVAVGQSPQAERKQLASARYHTNQRRIHPYFYCGEVQTLLSEAKKELKDKGALSGDDEKMIDGLVDFIRKNKDCLEYDNWTVAAKTLQDRIYDFVAENKGVGDLHSWLIGCLEYSIGDESPSVADPVRPAIEIANKELKALFAPLVVADPDNPEGNDPVSLGRISFAKLNIPLLLRRGWTLQGIERKLREVVALKDIDGVKLLIEYYVFNGEYQKASTMLSEAIGADWLNKYDKFVCEKVYSHALRNKIYDLIAASNKPSIEDLKGLVACSGQLDAVHRSDFNAAFGMLAAQYPEFFEPPFDDKLLKSRTSKLEGSVDGLDNSAVEYCGYAELSRLYLYHMQALLMALNALNQRLFPNKYKIKTITDLKCEFNDLAHRFNACIEKYNLASLDELRECFQGIDGLQVRLMSKLIDRDNAKLVKPAESAKLALDQQVAGLVGQLGSGDPSALVTMMAQSQELNGRFADLNRVVMGGFNKQVEKLNKPSIGRNNQPYDDVEKMNVAAFRHHFVFDKVTCHVSKQSALNRSVEGRAVGMLSGAIAGVFAGIGVAAYLLPVMFGVVLATVPIAGVIIGCLMLVGLAGYLIGAAVDAKIQASWLGQQGRKINLPLGGADEPVKLKNDIAVKKDVELVVAPQSMAANMVAASPSKAPALFGQQVGSVVSQEANKLEEDVANRPGDNTGPKNQA